MHFTESFVDGNPSPQICIAFTRDPDRGITMFKVWDFQSQELFRRELPTPDFDDLVARISAKCRMAEVVQHG